MASALFNWRRDSGRSRAAGTRENPYRGRAKISTKFGLFSAIAIGLSLAVFAAAPTALAQDVVVPMPGDYAPPGTPPAPQQLPDPTTILQDDGSIVAVPIPGGGEVAVEGPASEPPVHRSPIENWATQRNNPFSVGTGPIGPVPAQP
jgi:hypothetical protein